MQLGRQPDPWDLVDELQERVRQLEHMLAGEVEALPWERFTPQERRVFNCLMRHQAPTREMLSQAACGFSDSDGYNVSKVIICRVRKKLRKYGVDIQTTYGFGNHITPEDKERLRAL